MADEAQVKILKEKGVKGWNKWRNANWKIKVDLSRADLIRVSLSRAELNGANLSETDLRGADLSEANLSGANLSKASLSRANLSEANFNWADLSWADLSEANFSAVTLVGANLHHANLSGAKFIGANLSDTDLSRANVRGAILRGANLSRVDFSGAHLAATSFLDVDLSQTKGLETILHWVPSEISISTIYRSQGKIPESFLRKAGVPEPFIVHMKSLVAAMSPIEFYSCFISYSSKDQEFAERLHTDLRSKNVRCWFAPEDLKIGAKLRPAFDEAIRVHDKLMVLLSEQSVKSPWVEKEVETAFEKEQREKRTVLFPIRLDDAVMNTGEAWAADIRRTRHIGDFRDWKDHDSYKKAFERLLRDLKAKSTQA